jgi:hypothetical protein
LKYTEKSVHIGARAMLPTEDFYVTNDSGLVNHEDHTFAIPLMRHEAVILQSGAAKRSPVRENWKPESADSLIPTLVVVTGIHVDPENLSISSAEVHQMFPIEEEIILTGLVESPRIEDQQNIASSAVPREGHVILVLVRQSKVWSFLACIQTHVVLS